MSSNEEEYEARRTAYQAEVTAERELGKIKPWEAIAKMQKFERDEQERALREQNNLERARELLKEQARNLDKDQELDR